MKWNKKGQIYTVNNDNPFLVSHAANPLAVLLHDDVYRIYYSGRNIDNRSSVSYVDYDVVKNQIVNDHKLPIAIHGKDDSFYSHGISVGNMWVQNDECYIGFMGWQVKDGHHWRGDMGKLRVKNDIVEDISMLLGVNEEDLVSLSYPFVLFEDSTYKMWYGSTIDWTSENGEMIHVIKYATSKNGNDWYMHGLAIPYEIGVAQAFSRPTVIKIDNKYHMWFSFRSGDGTPYRIGHAISNNGIDWIRQKYSGIDVGKDGWDSEMICYPFVFSHKEQIFMLYNGNKYGKYGFGIAVLEKDVK